MEFTNEIFFNKPLIAGSTVIITYSGQLYREHSKDVSIVFGYGDDWSETDNAPMIETDNGFEITLTIKNYSTFNFCFKNNFNIWDNNSGFNYICPIKSDKNLNKNVENTEEEIEETQVQATDESETNDNTANFENNDIESLFSSLLDSILDDTNQENETIDVSNLPGFGLQSIDEIKEEDIINCDEIFAELFNELTGPEVTENVVNASVEENQQQVQVTEKDENYDKYDAQELDNLMDNLLTSIADNNNNSELATPIQQVEPQQKVSEVVNEVSGLPATIQKEDWVDKIINISYSISKKVTTACKKFGSLIKLKAKELGLISDK